MEDVLLLKLPGELCVSSLPCLIAQNMSRLKAVTALSGTSFPADIAEADLGAEGVFCLIFFTK